ncbi:hypothetical protein PSN45_002482 [Yamadazyma tenuis]|uniref:Sulfiredoxin n=1 Tax=Candida tenuis (strain ATCC 10573 / BCRC 21748 / CBS 615 / JCM 9827 / NBRC 10315 / NRRL Y-1498 / VKM Y-70) TaxID=590646 RepID=G3B0B4_CANTC|nr:sulfiredoxin [Yamadazyma tenuis ATCC 10573]EGV65360.1 sulfiredoxin [Yamadazyma tenuis ATCC 10573]WEJ94978.1 hypothetical protein PSN45_002482 [Yamadazyma tenuis]
MSIQTANIKVSEVPLSQIRRPIPPVLDYQKIDAMVSTLNGVPMASATCPIEEISSGELPPIDVFRVREEGKDYYFAFGGCHRFQAYDRINTDGTKEVMVKCKLLPATRKTLKLYLGGSVDEMFADLDKERET